MGCSDSVHASNNEMRQVGQYLWRRVQIQVPFAMEGLMTTTYQNTMAMAYFTDPSGENHVTQLDALQNPYYFAAILAVNQNIGHGTRLTGQTEISSTGHGVLVLVSRDRPPNPYIYSARSF